MGLSVFLLGPDGNWNVRVFLLLGTSSRVVLSANKRYLVRSWPWHLSHAEVIKCIAWKQAAEQCAGRLHLPAPACSAVPRGDSSLPASCRLVLGSRGRAVVISPAFVLAECIPRPCLLPVPQTPLLPAEAVLTCYRFPVGGTGGRCPVPPRDQPPAGPGARKPLQTESDTFPLFISHSVVICFSCQWKTSKMSLPWHGNWHRVLLLHRLGVVFFPWRKEISTPNFFYFFSLYCVCPSSCSYADLHTSAPRPLKRSM